MRAKKTLILFSTLLALTVAPKAFPMFKPLEKSSAADRHHDMMGAFNDQNWEKVLKHTYDMLLNNEKSIYAKHAHYFEGIALFHLGKYVRANEHLSTYMNTQESKIHFDDCIHYKFLIAEKFREGKSEYFYQTKTQLLDNAVEIYDEIANIIPQEDVAAQAIFNKGLAQLQLTEYSAAVDTFQSVAIKFPKHELALLSYEKIGQGYLLQCSEKHQNVELLDLANLNLKKLQSAFPKDSETAQKLSNMIVEMQEIFAQSFYEIAKFYERTKKPGASKIYYSKIIASFPDTKCAYLSKKRLDHIEKKKS